jgi:hypothetical protein
MKTHFSLGPVVSIGGALLLVVALFLDWFSPSINAWKAYEVLDLVLIFLAVAVICASLDRLGAHLPATPQLEHTVLPLSAVTFVIVISQILNHPPAAIGRENEVGLYLAIGGAVLMVAGAVAAVAKISVGVEPRAGARAGEDETERMPGSVD